MFDEAFFSTRARKIFSFFFFGRSQQSFYLRAEGVVVRDLRRLSIFGEISLAISRDILNIFGTKAFLLRFLSLGLVSRDPYLLRFYDVLMKEIKN